MNLAKARCISEKIHQCILMQIFEDDDLVDIGRIIVRAIKRKEKQLISNS